MPIWSEQRGQCLIFSEKPEKSLEFRDSTAKGRREFWQLLGGLGWYSYFHTNHLSLTLHFYYATIMNDILRIPIDFCNPTVPVTTEMVECVNSDGEPDHVLLMHVEASPVLHS